MRSQISIILFIFLYLCCGHNQAICQLTTPIRVIPSASPTPGSSSTPQPALKALPDFRALVDQKLQSFTTKKMVNDKLEDVKMSLKEVCPIDESTVAARIFREYGAIYLANGVLPPPRCIFTEAYQVERFQQGVKPTVKIIDRVSITLQQPAMDALLNAISKASRAGLRISPRGGSQAAARSYEDTRRLWNTRFLPGLSYWVKMKKLSQKDAENAKWLPTEAQVRQVLEWEEKGLFFSKDFTKSILYSVAAPGASQHISMLAIDIEQFSDKRVRDILAEFGWFQTVKSDLPHFTYLGELPASGLKKTTISGQDFWIPDLKQ